MEQIFIKTLLLMLIIQLSSASRVLNLNRFENFEERRLVCNDGSGGGYYTLLSPETASETAKNNWIFYLQGGGWCYDNSTCVKRIIENGAVVGPLVSSNFWPKTKEVKGIFEMSDPDWYNANLVYIPYCSSDAHMGDSDHQIDVFGETHFRGRRLVRAAVEELVGEKNNQEILFGGLSAGGRGSMVLIDFIQEVIGPNSTVKGVHDSGAYQDIETYDESYTAFGEQCRLAYNMYAPPISKTCADAYSGELWKCTCGEYMLPRIETPSQIIFYLYDSYQLGNAIGHAPKDWTTDMCRYANGEFLSGMRATARAINEASHLTVFAPACYRHGILTSSSFQEIKIDGLSAEDNLLSFINGIKVDAWSTCEGVNCQETCPTIQTGAQSFCDSC